MVRGIKENLHEWRSRSCARIGSRSVLHMERETDAHAHTMDDYSAIKKGNLALAICNNVDGPRGYDAKQNKSEKDNYHMISLVRGT